jgi:purine-binding chemotaxis protein CheW
VLAAGTPPLGLAFHDLDGHIRVPASVIVGEATAGDGHRTVRGMVTLPGGTRPIVDVLAARAAVHALTGHAHVTDEEAGL